MDRLRREPPVTMAHTTSMKHVNRLFQCYSFDDLDRVETDLSHKPWKVLGVSIGWYADDVDELHRAYVTEMTDPDCRVVLALLEHGETPDSQYEWRLTFDLPADSDYATHFYDTNTYGTEADAVAGLRQGIREGTYRFLPDRWEGDSP